jgi:hypothetical protein
MLYHCVDVNTNTNYANIVSYPEADQYFFVIHDGLLHKTSIHLTKYHKFNGKLQLKIFSIPMSMVY